MDTLWNGNLWLQAREFLNTKVKSHVKQETCPASITIIELAEWLNGATHCDLIAKKCMSLILSNKCWQ